jgi:hypothetical protein
MKKIFTLLFCVVAIGFASNASELPLVDRCINVLLGNEQTTQLMATELDANHDGIISIADVTTLIDEALQAKELKRARARNIDVEAIAKQVIATESGEPTINDVNQAIHQNLKNEE